jgi:hypothetical protein
MRGKDYAGALGDGVIKGLVKTAIQIEDQAVSNATDSVRTGRLRGSITWAIRNQGSHPRAPADTRDAVSKPHDKYTAHVGTNVEYAPYVEYGTVRFPSGKPYLRPAVDTVRHDMDMEQEIKNALRYEQQNMRRNRG